jgi:hypothetical protein
MKKVIAFVAVVVCFSATSVMAQGGGGGQQRDPAAMAAAMKERLAPANLTAVQVDSVLAIWNDRALSAAVYGTTDMQSISREDRQAKAPAILEARTKRLEKAIGAEATKKVVEIMSQRPGGGRPGGGGGK